MSEERWRRVEKLFHLVAALPLAERGAYLDAQCDEDEVRSQVEELLAWDEEAGDFIESAIGSASARAIEDHDPLGRKRTIGKYEIDGLIGRGGFGVVYRGRDPDLGREVAVKSCSALDPNLRRRFLQEAQIAARLQHPAIVVVHDLLLEEGVPFMVQELLGGEDLSALIARGERLSVAQRISILSQVARGLAYAHSQGVVHRDVKPSNIRLLADGSVKLLDFGVAKLLHEPTDLTQQGSALGTSGYLAPEQLEGGEVDERADLFAFGVVAYELLAERRPFHGATQAEVSYRLLHQEASALVAIWPRCPPALSQLVAGCLEKDRVRRPSTLAPVVAQLEALGRRHEGDPSWGAPPVLRESSGEPTAMIREDDPPRRRWALASVVALALLVVVVSLMRHRESNGPDRAALAPSFPPSSLPNVLAEPVNPGSAEHDSLLGQSRPAQERVLALGPTTTIVRENPAVASRSVNGESGDAKAAGEPPFEDPPSPVRELKMALAMSPVTQRDPGEHETNSSAPVTKLEAITTPIAAGAASQWPGVSPRPLTPADSLGTTGATDGESSAELDVEPTLQDEVLLRPGADVDRPRLIHYPTPVYPRSARRRRQEGQVLVAVLVDETGAVLQALIQRCEPRGLGFEEAALTAARAAQFAPAQRDGVAGKMWTDLPFEFSLGKERL